MKYAIAAIVLIAGAAGFIFWWRKRQADKLVNDAIVQAMPPVVGGTIGGNMGGGGGGLIGGTAASLGVSETPKLTLDQSLDLGSKMAAGTIKPQIYIVKEQPALDAQNISLNPAATRIFTNSDVMGSGTAPLNVGGLITKAYADKTEYTPPTVAPTRGFGAIMPGGGFGQMVINAN